MRGLPAEPRGIRFEHSIHLHFHLSALTKHRSVHSNDVKDQLPRQPTVALQLLLLAIASRRNNAFVMQRHS